MKNALFLDKSDGSWFSSKSRHQQQLQTARYMELNDQILFYQRPLYRQSDFQSVIRGKIPWLLDLFGLYQRHTYHHLQHGRIGP